MREVIDGYIYIHDQIGGNFLYTDIEGNLISGHEVDAMDIIEQQERGINKVKA